MEYEFVANDTGSKLVVTCVDNGTQTPVNLTGAGVTIRWRANGGAPTTPKAMDITDAANGIVEYLFDTGELVAGVMSFEIEITDAQSRKVRNLALIVERVRAPLA